MPIHRHHVCPQLDVLSSGLYRLLDLELTCWPGSLTRGWLAPNEYREVVQCGLLDFEYSSGSNSILITKALEYLVCAALNPILSDYFTDLTGISNQVLAREAISYEDAFASVRNEGCTLLANGDDAEILNNTMIQDFPCIALRGFELKIFLFRILDLETTDYKSSELPLLVESHLPPRRAHQALNDCWSVLQALAIGLSCELIDQSDTP